MLTPRDNYVHAINKISQKHGELHTEYHKKWQETFDQIARARVPRDVFIVRSGI